MKKINIAIDGFAGCGKSTTAKEVAKRLDYLFIDSGAMYRAVSLYFLRNGVDFSTDNEEVKKALENIKIDFQRRAGQHFPEVLLNGERVESEIRKPEISDIVSPVAILRSVREEMVAQQQRIAEGRGVVMDGRDIGTIVMPDAELKVFMTADVQVRAWRRMKELETKGVQIGLNEVIENLKERDRIDSTREVGPLKKAEDAIEIDTTHLQMEEQIETVIRLANEKILFT